MCLLGHLADGEILWNVAKDQINKICGIGGSRLPMFFEYRYSKGNTLNGNQNLDNYRYFVFIWFFIDRGVATPVPV